MRPNLFLLALVTFILVACIAETPEPLPTVAPTPVITQTPLLEATPAFLPQRVSMLRVALLGETTTTNVWSLFDEPGASYWNVVTQVGYWPSLYRLAPPDLDLWPATAQGDLPPVICDDLICTATVDLRPGLVWTDGSAFTAADVVFTVNTALEFEMGLNWRQFYNPSVLDHAEAFDERTVRFYFKSHPTVADWQYGALLGPIVNRAYWQPRIAASAALLPDEAFMTAIREQETELASVQSQLDEMNHILATSFPGSTTSVDTARRAKRLQSDFIGLTTALAKKYAEFDAKLAEARGALFTLENTNEPTLGPWKFASHIPGGFENGVNFDTPLGDPWFDSVRYNIYPDETAAIEALENNQVDLILSPNGISPGFVLRLAGNPRINLNRSITRSGRFLAINDDNPYLADPVLHRALACLLDPAVFVENLGSEVFPLTGFVLDEGWKNKTAFLPCADTTGVARTVEAIRLLKEAGYSWESEPALDANGSGFKVPDGNVLPAFRLLALKQDPLRVIAAQVIAQQARLIGLEIIVEMSSSDDLLYKVYGSGDFDMAVLGWHLSAYPSYLCDWFEPSEQNPFIYSGSNHRSACEAWAQVNDLGLAKSYAFEAQSILVQQLPLIPLYANARFDAYRNVHYPFTEVVDGLGGLYGAPELAIPDQ